MKKYFDEIIRKGSNAEFAEILVCDVLEKLPRELIRELVSGKKNWAEIYLLDWDRRERKSGNKNNAILTSTIYDTLCSAREENRLETDDIINLLDFSAKTKLIEFRLEELFENREESESIKDLMRKIRDFRNKYKGHNTETFKNELTDERMIGALKEIEQFVEQTQESAAPQRKLLFRSFLQNEWLPLTESYKLSIGYGTEVDRYETAPIEAEQLYQYNVLVEYTAFFSNHYRIVSLQIKSQAEICEL